jgi:hypothetical protein
MGIFKTKLPRKDLISLTTNETGFVMATCSDVPKEEDIMRIVAIREALSSSQNCTTP